MKSGYFRKKKECCGSLQGQAIEYLTGRICHNQHNHQMPKIFYEANSIVNASQIKKYMLKTNTESGAYALQNQTIEQVFGMIKTKHSSARPAIWIEEHLQQVNLDLTRMEIKCFATLRPRSMQWA